MARITKIMFARVGKQEGCLCDRCGQYIRNIWTVNYADGVTMNFGIDCFEALAKESALTTYGIKTLKKALKRIADYQDLLDAEKAKTEETDLRYQETQITYEWKDKDYWFGKPWAEYHKWMIDVFYPMRIADAQKEIARFRNVNFQR